MDKIDYMAIGKRIRYIRMEQGLTQEQMAELADVSTNYISRIELGNARFSLAVLIRVSNALNVSTDYILVDVIKRARCQYNKRAIGCEELSDTQLEFVEQIIMLAEKYHIVK